MSASYSAGFTQSAVCSRGFQAQAPAARNVCSESHLLLESCSRASGGVLLMAARGPLHPWFQSALHKPLLTRKNCTALYCLISHDISPTSGGNSDHVLYRASGCT